MADVALVEMGGDLREVQIEGCVDLNNRPFRKVAKHIAV